MGHELGPPMTSLFLPDQSRPPHWGSHTGGRLQLRDQIKELNEERERLRPELETRELHPLL